MTNRSDGTDQTTVDMTEERDPADAPVQPVDIGEIEVSNAEVLGAVEVNESEENNGGPMGLDLSVNFPWFNVDAAEVHDRLERGTYALVRLDGDER